MVKFVANLLILSLAAAAAQSSTIDDTQCDRQLAHFDTALDQRQHWALFVFDTWAKLPSSIFRGNRVNPGGFDDCVNFRHVSNIAAVGTFQGQHCMVNFAPTAEVNEIDREAGFDWKEIGEIARQNNFDFRHGFCLPASCSSQRILNYTNGYLSQAGFAASETRCQTNDPVKYEALDIFAITLFSIIALLLVSCTIYEIIAIRNNLKPNPLLASFSVYINGFKLYEVTKSKSPMDIRCLHGIRALSILYIIFGHRYGVTLGAAVANWPFLNEWFSHFHIGLYHTHQVPVDVFLLMGGLLVAMSVLRSLDSNRLSILRMYLHRYLRYTPVLAALLLFVVTLMKHVVFGPLENLDSNIVVNCEKWWWTTLLHVQNYVNPNEICLSHSWYLSVDFQLFIISPFLIWPARKYGWKYLWVLPALTLLSSIYIFVISMVYRVTIIGHIPDPASFDFFIQWIYYPTHARMGPWTLGMTLGYIFYQNRQQKIRLNPIVNAAMWILTMTVFAAITMGSQIMFLPESVNNTSLLANAFYLAFYRNGWALATFWMVFAIHNGTGGFIRWFLELPQWQPLGRMGLSMYLLSFMFQHVTVMNLKFPIYFDEFQLIHAYWGDIFATVMLATVGYLAFEVPFLTIESYIYNLFHQKKTEVTKI